MEIGLREWLIVIGIIVIAGILFDGWRRMRGGKGKLKFRLDRNLSNLPDDDGSADPRVTAVLEAADLPDQSTELVRSRRNWLLMLRAIFLTIRTCGDLIHFHSRKFH